jgi:YbbR domain-containing protein
MLDRIWVNWPLKLLSISLAFAIWVFVSGEKRIVQDFDIPLDIQLSDQLALLDAPRSAVSVRLRGPESLIRRLDPVGLEVAVALGDAPLGQQQISLSKSNVQGVPRGIDVDFIEPDSVEIELDRREQRTFMLDVAFLGQPPEGYAFYGTQIDPDRLTLEGPESELTKLDLLQTEPIRLDQRREPFTRTVRAIPPHPSLRALDSTPIRVRIDVDVEPVVRTFTGVPVEAIGQVYETTVAPTGANVTLSGPPALLGRLRPQQLRLAVDVSGLTPFDQPRQRPVELDLIDVPVEEMSRISMKSVDRREVAVWISERRLR